MNKFLQLKKSNCKNCYKCIRNCPVKSIKFSNEQANIIPDECILCGMCFVSCPQNAKKVRNDIPAVTELIASGKKVIASVAPSFIAEFNTTSFAPLQAALTKLGFFAAEETAIGATIVKKEYENMLASGEHNIIISSCCHSINTLIQKYHPGALPYLANVLSPMLAHCKDIKQRYPDCATVFIGPCISKKEEAELYGYTDVALTFEEFEEWLEQENIVLEDNADAESAESGKKGRFFPITGGILRSMDTSIPGYSYLAIDGVENCIAAISEIEKGNIRNCFIEMSACTGSCINGPGIAHHHKARLSGEIRVRSFAGEDEFIVPDNLDINKKMPYVGIHATKPGESVIKDILAKMGKTSPEKELNCGSCGYNTCREKAIAVYLGKADLSMCLPFLKEKAESFSDNLINNTPNGIFVLDENLNIQQINRSACGMFRLSGPEEVIGQPIVKILNPTDYLSAITMGQSVKESKHYLAEYDKYVAETIIYDKEYRMLYSFMRDITAHEQQAAQRAEMRSKTVEITNAVIEKQMRVVQEIASLLGETTAETKIALTQLKNTLEK